MKFQPRPVLQRAGSWTGNGAGNNLTGSAWGTTMGPRWDLWGLTCFSRAPPFIWCPMQVPVFCHQGIKCRPHPSLPCPATHHLGPRFVSEASLFFQGPASIPVDRNEPHVFPIYHSPLPYFYDKPSRTPHFNLALFLQALDCYRAPCNCSFSWLDHPNSV